MFLGIDINEKSASKECGICHYHCLLDKKFKLQLNVCNGWHDVLLMAINFNSIAF